MAAVEAYPVRVGASLDRPLSRWLWLFKWVLVIPHCIALAILWAAFMLLSVVAFFAILLTGRYPRGIFEFNVGVLRWTWRVQYYSISAFGTDQYPPFTLADDPSYPARLEVGYPERLSRGLVLVKWWLLAIPQYIIVGLFASGGLWFAWNPDHPEWDLPWLPGGLIGILALIAAVILLVTGRYPEQVFDFLLGMDRWVLRVAAYAGLMTDKYPPFRLDMGGQEPGETLAVTPPQLPEAAPEGRGPSGWTAGRITAVVIGAILVLCSLGMLGAGGVALWAQTSQRHGDYVDLGTASYETAGYALASDRVELHAAGGGWDAASAIFGTVRISVTPADGKTPVFAGIAPSGTAEHYLSGMAYSTVRGSPGHRDTYLWHAGSAPPVPPGQAGFWTTQAAGPGTRVLLWPVRSGDWTIVVMNADSSRPVAVHVNLAATLPALPWIAAGLLIGGVVFLAGGIVLLAIPIARATRPQGPASAIDRD